jgi:drug/metabolite transporter (DMT)-like permease
MEKPLLSLLLAFAGYSLQNIALAGQKIGLFVAARHRRRGLALWLLATAGMPPAIMLVLAAVSMGNATLVGVMAGTGLASLAVFSHVVMREHIHKREMAGVAVILVAAVLIGVSERRETLTEPRPQALYLFMAAVSAVYAVAWVALARRRAAACLVVAGLAGAIGGFIPLLQKLSTTPQALASPLVRFGARQDSGFVHDLAEAADWLTNPWALGWIAASVLSMLVIQFAYRHDRAVRLIPAFAANTIAVPVVGGVLAFGTRLRPLQWLGVALVAAGVLLLTCKLERPCAAGPAD